MQVRIDRERCQASGLCEALAPQVFRLGADVAELIEGAEPAAHADKVAAAMDSCPMEAIRRTDPAPE